MSEKFVAKLDEFKDGERRIVFVGDNEIGVFRHRGAFYAGMEYDMKTGECVADRRMKLKKFEVVQKGDEVYVLA
ncbi:MAG TPA: hypothetical protein VMV19_20560 [Xanthobacteraceae bacterium]|nr:hypothetical protein [Xanthobacteraceae bacterium]